MKFDAHPLIVAVALGLLGPGALVADDGDDEAGLQGIEDENAGSWEPLSSRGAAPSAEEFHRVELEWLKQS